MFENFVGSRKHCPKVNDLSSCCPIEYSVLPPETPAAQPVPIKPAVVTASRWPTLAPPRPT
uniref:Uncharacterized protein n=1 Tax=Timema cristinae TaxID=61476 RepID=A0A7R9GUH9_TIMCR|nr:unnamed protein product [Timema cristinae]